MKRPALLVFSTLVACSSSAPETPDAGEPPPGDAPVSGADQVVERSARAICGALFRCCDDDLVTYFAPLRENKLLESFRGRLPPEAVLDEPGCRLVVAEMLAITPLGDWIGAVQRGEVELDAAAFDACIARLDAAACGEPARSALWDSRCLGFAAPAGGAEQRAMFRRVRGAGASCAPIRDGMGAAFYGTCDPQTAFCCYSAGNQSGCQLPFDGDGNPRAGTCTPVAGPGEACSPFQPIKLCATGQDCDADTETCLAPSNATLAVGEVCIDAGYHLLGTCESSWCDVLGSKHCEPLRDDGVACGGGEECRSGLCESVCTPNTICTAAAAADVMAPQARVRSSRARACSVLSAS